MFVQRKQSPKGFTLVELLVTITIFVILTGVVLFNNSKFNSTILLTNLAYDTALTIRQAQTYGINIKEFSGSTADGSFVPYGVHFEKGAKSFILFADIDFLMSEEPDVTYPFIYFSSSHVNKRTDKCLTVDGCVSRYNILRGNYIKDLCETEVEIDSDVCPVVGGVSTSRDSLDILFVRPNPDARLMFDCISSDSDCEISDSNVATVILGGADGTVRKVRVRDNGLIEIVK